MNEMKNMNVKMKNKEKKGKLPSRLLSLALAVAMLLPLISSLPMPVFAAEGNGITYVGTHGSGNALNFAHGAGYNVYKLYSSGNAVEFENGMCPSGEDLSFYLIPDTYNDDNIYNIIECKMWDEDTGSTVQGNEVELADGGLQVTIAAEDMLEGRHIKVSVSVAVNASGGKIGTTSTAYAVAQMFDASYHPSNDVQDLTTIVTNNVTVIKDESTFTVTLGNNILLKGTGETAGFTVGTDATLTVLSSGDYTIKRGNRGSYVGNMFYVSKNATLNLGSGTLANNTVTYFYSDGTSITKEITGTVDEPGNPTYATKTVNGKTVSYVKSFDTQCVNEIPGGDDGSFASGLKSGNIYLINAVSNAVVTGTMQGTLTIDGGAIFEEYTSGREGGAYCPGNTNGSGANNKTDGVYNNVGTRYDGVSTPSPDDSAEGFSTTRRPQNFNYTLNHWALIKTTDGTINMWPGVTLQNNYGYNSDIYENGSTVNINGKNYTAPECGGGAIKIWQGGNFYMYGGLIQNAIIENAFLGLNWNGSDGGAILEQGGKCRIYLYGGEIRYCEATHGSVLSMRSNATDEEKSGLWIFDTNIHHNYSTGLYVSVTPPKTIAIFNNNNADIKMFGGSIHNNDNPIEKPQDSYPDEKYKSWWYERSADISISTSADADFTLYGGQVDAVSCSADETKATLNIYAASVDKIMWGGSNSNVYYPADHVLRAVTVPNSTEHGANVTVTVECKTEAGVTYSRLTTSGTAGSRDLTLRLPDGKYIITVNSPSMVKEYSVTVNGVDAKATTVSRTVTQPILVSKNSESVTLSMIGTDNVDADGIMYYGCAYDDEPRHTVAWYYIDLGDNGILDQTDKIYVMKQNGVEKDTGKYVYAAAVPYTESAFVFDAEARTVTIKYEFGPRYYFGTSGHVGVEGEDGYLKGEASDGHFENLVRVDKVEIIPSEYTSTRGSIATYSAVVTYDDQSTDNRVKWSFVGGTSATTTITEHGVLHIAYDEQAEPTLKTYSTIAEGLNATELTFTNGVYKVPAEGLPYGYYYIVDGVSEYYFLTTSKLLEDDELTWNAQEGTVTQSVNRIFVTAYATVDGTKTAEAMWVQSTDINADSHISEVDILLNGALAGRVTEFKDQKGTENSIDYERTATVTIHGALPDSNIFPHVVATAADAKVDILGVYNGAKTVEFDGVQGYVLNTSFGDSTYVYIDIIPPDSDKRLTYRLEIKYTQAKNSWVTEPYCAPVNKGTPLSPIAEALYGDVSFTWEKLDDGKWVAVAGTPTDVGVYRLTASVAETTFYTGIEMSVQTEIYQSTVEWIFDNLTATPIEYGQTLENSEIMGEVTLKENGEDVSVTGTFYWVDSKAVPEVDSGIYYTVGFEPYDSSHGKIVAGELPAPVEKATPVIETEPTVLYDGMTPSQYSTLASLNITAGVACNEHLSGKNHEVAGYWTWTQNNLSIDEQLGKAVSIHFVPNDTKNYSAVTTTVILKISITVTAENQEIFYGETIDQSRYTISDYFVWNGGAGNPIASIILTQGSEVDANHKGSITPKVTLLEGEEAYYNIIYNSGTVTYKLLTPTLTISAGELVTSGQNMMMQFTYTYDGYAGDDGVDGVEVKSSVSAIALISDTQGGTKGQSYIVDDLSSEKDYFIFVQATKSEYGSSIITIHVPKKGHYAAVTGSFTFSVTKDGTIIVVDPVNVTYDGKSHKPVGTYYKDSTSGPVYPNFYKDEEHENQATNFIDAVDTTLYYIVEINEEKYVGSTTFTIAPKELTVTWSDLSKVYTGEEQSPSCSVSETGVEGEKATVSPSFVGGNPTNAGTYTAIAKLTIEGESAKSENYTLINATSTFIIKVANVSINTDNPTYTDSVYDAVVVESPEWQAMFGEKIVSELLGYTFYKQVTQGGETEWIETTAGDGTGAIGNGTAPINAGQYGVRATYSAENGGNFAEAVTEIKIFSIKRRPITITTVDQVSYNADLTADPDATKVTVEGGEIPGHKVVITEVSGTCTLEQGKAEKTFKASIKDSQGNDVSSNYTITTESGFLYVFPAFVVSGEEYNEITEPRADVPEFENTYAAVGTEESPVVHLNIDEIYSDDNVPLSKFSGGTVDVSVTSLVYRGWIAYNGTFGQFGYQIDGNDAVFNDSFAKPNADDAAAVTNAANKVHGADYGIRMWITADISTLSGNHTVRILYKNTDGTVVLLNTLNIYRTKTDVGPAKNDAFSFYFGTLYKPNGPALSIHFGNVLPVNSTVTMVDYTGDVPVYYYYICGDSTSEITLTEFIKMGTANTLYVDSNEGETQTVKYLQFIVRHPTGEVGTKYEPELYQGTELVSKDSNGGDLPISVTLSAEAVGGDLKLEAVVVAPSESNAGSLSMTVTVGGLDTDGGRIAVELLAADGTTQCDYPAGAQIRLGDYTPVLILDNIAYFDAVKNGTYAFELDMKEAHMLSECEYKLKVQLWTSASGEAKKTVEPNDTAQVKKYIRNAISVQSGNRTATALITFTVRYIGTVPIDTELTCEKIQYRAETDDELRNVDNLAWNITIGNPKTKDGVKTSEVTISDLSEVAEGIYVLTFVYGNATYLYAFIVER